MPCSLVEIHQRFGETYCLHLQFRRVSQASSTQILPFLFYLLAYSAKIFLPTLVLFIPDTRPSPTRFFLSIRTTRSEVSYSLLNYACCSLLVSLLRPENGSSMYPRNNVQLLSDRIVSYPRRHSSSKVHNIPGNKTVFFRLF
jgi:hypothetical protein